MLAWTGMVRDVYSWPHMPTLEDSFLRSNYLTVQQAAEYIGVSVQTLRRWDAAGKLTPVRHPVNGYRYYLRADLEPYRVEYQAAGVRSPDANVFQIVKADVEANELLREPQKESHRAVAGYFAKNNGHVILQIPVGCGKTGVMATVPFGVSQGRVLIITPNTTIRRGVSASLDITGPKSFYRKTKVLTDFKRGPYTAVLDGPNANLDDCTKSHFVVTNIQQLASSADRWLPQFPPNFFDMILVDEGHHNVAPSWRKVFERFPEAKVISLTATPFRGDQKRMAGEVIYRYSFTRAMINGYIKQIHSSNVAPEEIYFTYRDDSHRHTLEEVIELREEQWFRRGVALSEECNRHIVDASIKKLEAARKTGTQHQIIAVACSIDHARQVASLYTERGLRAMEIYSEMDEDEQQEVLRKLEQGRLDCIVQVKMLGEGFDHPPLSVAALFRPFRSLSPYIQFVGRIMRVVKEGAPEDPDNQGYVVSHVGLSNDEHWEDFKELDLADQQLFHKWLTEQESDDAPAEADGTGTPRRFENPMQVSNEILGQYITSAFLDLRDDRVVDEILNRQVAAGFTFAQISGLTRGTLREKLKSMMPERSAETPDEIPVQPQKRRQYYRKRLAQRTNSVVARILKDLSLAPVGREVGRAIKKVAGSDNRQAVTELLSRAVNEFLGIKSKQRNKIKLEQAEEAFNNLDAIADRVRDTIRESMT